MNEKRPLTFNLFLLRLLSGIAGGMGGMLIAFVALFLITSFVPAAPSSDIAANAASDGTSTLGFFAVIVMAFLATISGNTITAVSLTFMDSEKYSRRKTIITQVFLFNLVLFFLTIPLYLIAIPLEITTGVAALHFLLSAFVSSLIMEILAGYEYSLVGIYANSLGIFVSICLALIILNTTISPQVIILGAMPMVWFMLELIGSFAELVYDNYFHMYGVDALNTQTDLGGDAEKDDDSDDSEDETKV